MSLAPIDITKRIIRVREKLIRNKKSAKNLSRCVNYIKELNNYINAYESKWTAEQAQRFVINHYAQISYLVPENKTGHQLKTKLYESIQSPRRGPEELGQNKPL